jgi:hypothetical protein
MQAITKAQILDYFNDIIEDPMLASMTNPRDLANPDSCLYQDGNGNHCLVGHWLNHYIGIDDEWMYSNIESKSADAAIEKAVEYDLIGDIEPKAIELLTQAQMLADAWHEQEGEREGILIAPTWGEVVSQLLIQE